MGWTQPSSKWMKDWEDVGDGEVVVVDGDGAVEVEEGTGDVEEEGWEDPE